MESYKFLTDCVMDDQNYMQIAYLMAQSSKCVSWAVGAIIVKDGRIIATGYNGSPQGHVNCCDHAKQQGWLKNVNGFEVLAKEFRLEHSSWSDKHENHAEQNAITFAARHGVSIDGATFYVTLSPCMHCSKILAQSGVKRVVYGELYDRNGDDWNSTLLASNIKVDFCPIDYEKTVLDFSKLRTFKGES